MLRKISEYTQKLTGSGGMPNLPFKKEVAQRQNIDKGTEVTIWEFPGFTVQIPPGTSERYVSKKLPRIAAEIESMQNQSELQTEKEPMNKDITGSKKAFLLNAMEEKGINPESLNEPNLTQGGVANIKVLKDKINERAAVHRNMEFTEEYILARENPQVNQEEVVLNPVERNIVSDVVIKLNDNSIDYQRVDLYGALSDEDKRNLIQTLENGVKTAAFTGQALNDIRNLIERLQG